MPRVRIQRALFLALPLAALAGAIAIAAPAPGAFDEHTVKKGQSVSYIAFLKLGAYNDSIARVIKADNPQLADLDRVPVGTVLKLRRAPEADKLDPKKKVSMASRKAVVTLAEGKGEIRRADGRVEPLLANRFLQTGDAVVVAPDGFAELIIDNQSVLRLHGDTEIRLTAIQAAKPGAKPGDKPVTQIALMRGKTWAKVQKWAGGLVGYEIKLPSAIAGVHGTVFETEVSSDSSGAVSVYQGEVGVGGGQGGEPPKRSLAPRRVDGPKEVSQAEWIRIVREGMRISVPKSGEPGQPEQFEVAAGDPWVDMNRQRDCLCD